MTWLALGYLALLACADQVAKGRAPAVMDVVFFAVVVAMVVVRWVDITKFKGHTAAGKPATLADWREYSLILAAVSTGLWALARLAAARGWMP